jgi:hypothetical protein
MRAAALKLGILSQEEFEHLAYTERLRRDVIKVDDFDPATLGRGSQVNSWQPSQAKPKAVAASL